MTIPNNFVQEELEMLKRNENIPFHYSVDMYSRMLLKEFDESFLYKMFPSRIVMTTWKERLIDLLHFRKPRLQKYEMVMPKLPDNKNSTIKFRRYPTFDYK